MKISTTKDGTVTFAQMTPSMAQALIDLAHDLARGNAVLLYSPEYDPIAVPDESLKGDLAKVALADDRYPGAVSLEPFRSRFETRFLSTNLEVSEDLHDTLWGEITSMPPTKEN